MATITNNYYYSYIHQPWGRTPISMKGIQQPPYQLKQQAYRKGRSKTRTARITKKVWRTVIPSSDDNMNKRQKESPLSDNTNKRETESPSSSFLQLNVTRIIKISMTDSLFQSTSSSFMHQGERTLIWELFSLRIENSDGVPVRYPLSWPAAPFCCLMNVPNANCSFWGENSMGGYRYTADD